MIVLPHCSTFRAVLNVALGSPKGYQMSLRLPWVSSLSPHVEPGYRRMVGAVLLVTVHAKRVMPVSTGRQIVSLPLVTNHRHIYREAKRGEGPQASESSSHSSRAGTLGASTWVRWLHNPCRLGDPHRFRAGGQNQRWPTSGQGGYITPAASGVPTASKWGTLTNKNAQTGSHQPRSDPEAGSRSKSFFVLFSHF